jgi:hypothetical protein
LIGKARTVYAESAFGPVPELDGSVLPGRACVEVGGGGGRGKGRIRDEKREKESKSSISQSCLCARLTIFDRPLSQGSTPSSIQDRKAVSYDSIAHSLPHEPIRLIYPPSAHAFFLALGRAIALPPLELGGLTINNPIPTRVKFPPPQSSGPTSIPPSHKISFFNLIKPLCPTLFRIIG